MEHLSVGLNSACSTAVSTSVDVEKWSTKDVPAGRYMRRHVSPLTPTNGDLRGKQLAKIGGLIPEHRHRLSGSDCHNV